MTTSSASRQPTPTVAYMPNQPPLDDDEAIGSGIAEAARLAGWNPADGAAPFLHHLPPAIDEDLGHNGIAPTDAERTA